MGIVIDGRVYSGHGALAGKLGWTVFPRPGPARTMTELVSAKGIVRRAIEALGAARRSSARDRLLEKADDLSLADLVAAAEGDRLIRDLLEQVGRDLGLVAANLANLFAPEKILLAGEVPSCCPLVREALEEEFRRYTVPEILREIVLADGSLSAFAGALGAAYLGFLRTFSEEVLHSVDGEHPPLIAAGP
jgi:predicted NBD/HSP70 family sugar kinase